MLHFVAGFARVVVVELLSNIAGQDIIDVQAGEAQEKELGTN